MRTANICPTCATYTNAVCVIYNGDFLSSINVSPMENLSLALVHINSTVQTKANLSTNTALGASDTLYPSQNAVATYVSNRFIDVMFTNVAQTVTAAKYFNPSMLHVVNTIDGNTAAFTYDSATTNTSLVIPVGVDDGSAFVGTLQYVEYLTTDGTLAANSDVLYPSEKAVKTYVDGSMTNVMKTDAIQTNTAAKTFADRTLKIQNLSTDARFTIIADDTAGDDALRTFPTYYDGVSSFDATVQYVENKSVDGTFAANSDTLYPSQKATKTYVDAQKIYKSYVAYLNQTGGSNPSVTVIHNDLSGAINWYVDSTGIVRGDLTAAFPTNKVVFFSSSLDTHDYQRQFNVLNANRVQIQQRDFSGVLIDDFAINIEIRVYN
jgi:hypothetical protein